MAFDPLAEDVLEQIFKTSPKYPDRLIKREDKNHEFKESFNFASMAMYFKTIAAFANNEGGYLIFGVKDRPHILRGLSGKPFEQFQNLKTEVLTQNLQEYFSPDIEWISCVYEFREKSYGIIYVFPLKIKPAICKKSYDCQDDKKYSLKESDIFYRYAGRSERIKYPDLQRIIDEKRAKEEKDWLRFLMKAAKIGVENACILDMDKGEIQERGGKIIIDEPLLEKMRFIREGEFVEKDGAPALRLIGDIETIESGKVVVGATKKVIRAIEQSDIVEDFLSEKNVENPEDYIKRICSSTTGNLPVFFYIHLAGIDIEKAKRIVNGTTARTQAKRILQTRLENDSSATPLSFGDRETAVSRNKKGFVNRWLNESISDITKLGDDLKYCVAAVRYLSKDELLGHKSFVFSKMMEIYKALYESSDSSLAQELRTAICYLDEILYK